VFKFDYTHISAHMKVDLFDSLPPKNASHHLPVGGTVYKFLWADDNDGDDWKADGY